MTKKPLIIFTHGGGRLANQLLCYANLLAFLIENNCNTTLINWSFFPYEYLLETPTHRLLSLEGFSFYLLKALNLFALLLKYLPSPISVRLNYYFLKALYLVSNIFSNMKGMIADDRKIYYKFKFMAEYNSRLSLEEDSVVKKIQQTPTTLLGGFNIRCWSLVRKHQDKVKDYLHFKQEYFDQAGKFIQELRQKHDYLIGVSIRQTDYKTWADGRYFFETKQYIEWIKKAQTRFSDKKNIGFIIASDNAQDLSLFEDLPVYLGTGNILKGGNYVEDMIELSMCDLILTPPTTFSAWASFMGKVPLLPLYDTKQNIFQTELLYDSIFDALQHHHLSMGVH
ncbi:MAG: glycosyl transferase family 11 [Microcystaceae cyanobacterium]